VKYNDEVIKNKYMNKLFFDIETLPAEEEKSGCRSNQKDI